MQNVRKPSYQKPQTNTQGTKPAAGKGARAPYNLTFAVGDKMVRLTGLFANTSEAGKDYLGVKKIRSADIHKLIEVLQDAAEKGADVGAFVFESKPQA